jgi:hypothetical protein
MHIFTDFYVFRQPRNQGELIFVKECGGEKRAALLYVRVNEETFDL